MNAKRIAATVAVAVAAVGIAAGSASANYPVPPSIDHVGCPSHLYNIHYSGYIYDYVRTRVGQNTQGEYGVYKVFVSVSGGPSSLPMGNYYQYWC